MAQPEELDALTRAFSGHGVDEKSLIAILGSSQLEKRQSIRKSSSDFFKEDERLFERWDEHRLKLLKHEFMRFKNAIVQRAMHPWERDARLLKEALSKGPESYNVIVEVACTRSSDELLGARRAYHSLFHHSIEEDVVSHVTGDDRKLLVSLVSAYRYEGPKTKEDAAKKDAKALHHAISEKKKLVDDEQVVAILSTRSKKHLQVVFHYYKETNGRTLDEDLGADLRLQETVQCLCTPEKYFAQILEISLKTDAHKKEKKALTRIIVSRADVDIDKIKEVYERTYGVSLADKIEETTKGNYKDFLLTLLAKGE